jgi:hypothetical protein
VIISTGTVSRVLPHSSLSIRGIIQNRKFPMSNRCQQYLGRADTSRRRSDRSERTHTTPHARASTVRDPTASYWPEYTWETLFVTDPESCPLRQYSSRGRAYSISSRRRTIHAKASNTYIHHECGILPEQKPHRRRAKVASLTCQEMLHLPNAAKNSNVLNTAQHFGKSG